MPVTFGGGASGLDPIVPALSKSYTYQNVVDLVRILAHASGNTTVITDAEIFAIVKDYVAQIAKENPSLFPNYLQSNTFNIGNTSNPYKVDYSTLNPYPDKIIGCVYVAGTSRTPIAIVSSEELERRSKLTSTGASSVFGTLNDGNVELFVGSNFSQPTFQEAEIYYNRQPAISSSTVSTYVDLPDNMIPDLIDTAVARLELTKE